MNDLSPVRVASAAHVSAPTPSVVVSPDETSPVRTLPDETSPDETLPVEILRDAYRRMTVGRRLNVQATNLAKQGLLTVYASSRGQEACQIAAAMALEPQDWLFPTYRDSIAMIARGLDPADVLAMFRGDRHCGFDPLAARTAPHAAPLATQCAHAVGAAMAARRLGTGGVALALCGDGATSEGDFHEAVNLAAVFEAPVVFLVQHNGYAISTPSERQCRARSLADKAIGYGIDGVSVDGDDLPETLAALQAAVRRARETGAPSLIEARTYRLDPHTNADDPTLYRDPAEAKAREAADPIGRLEAHLMRLDALDDALTETARDEAERAANALRRRVLDAPPPDPAGMFDHVYAAPPPHLAAQRADALAEYAS